ncbi:putative nuclear cap binding protein [Trypanosoma grayi]|uniref:putative nuclear cap binding protein n=1 Tax=Trypanosoma grayi TaxID=71804 RepID=UPI0004F44BFB|nr:putative nuclear cap binding protein [Trypanosoma grayi]KEG09897.1 putative nuclear cap binding protein [Trypanosoma grayi]
MNSRGRGVVGFRGGRGGASGPSALARSSSGRGGRGGREGFTRGHSRGRGAAGRPNTLTATSLDDSDDDGNDKRNGAATAKKASDGTSDKRSTPRPQHHVVTTVTESGTELPKKLNNKVFIDGLPYESKTTSGSLSLEEELMQFATAWKVGKPLRLIKKDGQGFGFLVFHSPHSVDVAVRVLNGRKFLGRTLRVEVPKLKDMEPTVDSERDAGKSSYARQVLLSDLAKVAQPEIIREILRDVAPQLEKRLESIKMTSKNRKAFLTFLAESDVEPAVKFLDGFAMLGRRTTATRAAAPGSLPYSKVPHRNTATGKDDSDGISNNNNNNGDDDNDDDGAPVLPLGVEPLASTRQVGKRTEVVKASKQGKLSNVTGVTEKYNLLDKGPAEVFVGNLGEEITQEQLCNHFSVSGKIKSCEILTNKDTCLPTGIARIVFALPAYAAHAQQHLHGSRLQGHILRVDRGEEASAPLASELAPPDDEEEIDEDGYMEQYGVTDKAAYFKGTSLEEKRKRSAGGNSSTSVSSKRTREDGADSKKAKTKTRTEEFKVSGSIPVYDDDDDDDEERFLDVDDVGVPTTSASGGRRSAKKRPVAAKPQKKAKKSSK